MQFLDGEGLGSLIQLIKNAISSAVSNYKPKQIAVSDPSANGTSTTFIATAEQDEDGKITIKKMSVPTVAASSNGSGGNAGMMTAAQAEKLAGISAGAQVNSITGVKGDSETNYRTGNVNITKANIGLGNVTDDAQVKRSEMGAANGVATLDANGKVPASQLHSYATLDENGKVPANQLPSYVDDIVELNRGMSTSAPTAGNAEGMTYFNIADNKIYRHNGTSYVFLEDPTSSKIYADTSSGGSSSKIYRWGGSSMIEISTSAPGTGNLTISKNGTTLGSFNANATSDETIDITVPTVSSNVHTGELLVWGGNNTVEGADVAPEDLAPKTHTHGNITNDGKLQTNDVTIADGDKLVVTDSSDGGKIARTSVTFDGSTTSKALTQKGTFETFLKSHQTVKQDGISGATVNRYASCSTAAGTAAKAANVTSGTPTLETGLHVFVKFTNANTAASPTLNINSTGAKAITYDGSVITTDTEKLSLVKGLCEFVYDGTNWNLINKVCPLSQQDISEIWAAN